MKSARTARGRISAVFEFAETGRLRAVYLNAETDRDQAILQRSLDRILNPQHLGWLRRLFRHG